MTQKRLFLGVFSLDMGFDIVGSVWGLEWFNRNEAGSGEAIVA